MQAVIDTGGKLPATLEDKLSDALEGAKLWNRPGYDKVGIEFTGSQPDPNFLPSLAPTNHPSVLVYISIFFYLREIKNK